MARKKARKPSNQQLLAYGQVALMLSESLLHVLVEADVLTKAQVLDAIDTVAELAREATERRERFGPSALAITDALTRTFSAKSAR